MEDIHLVTDPWTKESRGFGFVTMSSLDEANRCIKYLNRSVLEGRVITVEKVYVRHYFFCFCPLPLSRLLSYQRRSAFPKDWYSFKHCNYKLLCCSLEVFTVLLIAFIELIVSRLIFLFRFTLKLKLVCFVLPEVFVAATG